MQTQSSVSHSRQVIPDHVGLKIEQSIIIARPAAEIFQFWRKLENLPRFMDKLVKVQQLDGIHSRWTVLGPMGRELQWDSKIIGEREGKMIGWCSLQGDEAVTAGSAWFVELPKNRGTEVRVQLKYAHPGGRLGRALVKLLGRDPAGQLREDLRKLKWIFETGEIPTIEGQPHGPSESESESKSLAKRRESKERER